MNQHESDILNQAIAEQCDVENDRSFAGGKRVPYIGWFWRKVDFTDDISLGIIPASANDGTPYIGFMENNKWDYDYIRLTAEEKEVLVAMIRKAVNSHLDGDFHDLCTWMQNLRIVPRGPGPKEDEEDDE